MKDWGKAVAPSVDLTLLGSIMRRKWTMSYVETITHFAKTPK